MVSVKIACLGGGSFYFNRAVPDLLLSRELAGSEIVLYDIMHEKSERMAAMGQRLAERAGTGFRVRAAMELADTLDGADFALASIGGSGAEITDNVYQSRTHTADVRIPAKYGLQQIIGDTGGPAGMMMALRTIPVYLNICREMERRCPRAVLLNHANPMAALCRAMHKYSSISSIGICHGVQEGIHIVASVLGVPAQELECRWIGTNHYHWFTQILHRGVDLRPELERRLAERPTNPEWKISNHLSKIYGHRIVYPDDSHLVEFYPFLAQAPGGQGSLPGPLAHAAKAHGNDEAASLPQDGPPTPPTPDEKARFFEGYQRILDEVELPEAQDNSITGEGIGAMVTAMATGKREVFIVNVANQGAIPNLPATAEVEIDGVTGSRGVRPVHMGECPLVLKGILEKRFVWHELVADAAVTGDRRLALQAVMLDEHAIWPDKAEAMLDELLAASRPLLPAFFK